MIKDNFVSCITKLVNNGNCHCLTFGNNPIRRSLGAIIAAKAIMVTFPRKVSQRGGVDTSTLWNNVTSQPPPPSYTDILTFSYQGFMTFKLR